LQALAAGRDTGAKVDQEAIERGLRALLHCRSAKGTFTYGYSAAEPHESVEAAAGRMPLCELALLQWGKAEQPSPRAALDAGFANHGLLAAVRKYDDHADQYHYGGFFFWFDMLGRTEATMQLADAAPRGALQAQQKQLVLDLPEFDGCFVDSHELGRCYGTAMALLGLASLSP